MELVPRRGASRRRRQPCSSNFYVVSASRGRWSSAERLDQALFRCCGAWVRRPSRFAAATSGRIRADRQACNVGPLPAFAGRVGNRPVLVPLQLGCRRQPADLPGMRPRMAGRCACRVRRSRTAHYRCTRHPAGGRRQRRGDQGPQGQGQLVDREDRHQGSQHPAGRGRPRHRLPDRGHRRDEAEIGVRQQSLSNALWVNAFKPLGGEEHGDYGPGSYLRLPLNAYSCLPRSH